MNLPTVIHCRKNCLGVVDLPTSLVAVWQIIDVIWRRTLHCLTNAKVLRVELEASHLSFDFLLDKSEAWIRLSVEARVMIQFYISGIIQILSEAHFL